MIDELKDEVHLFNLLRQLFLKEPTKELVNGMGKIRVPLEADDLVSNGLKLIVDSIKKNEHRLDEWLGELSVEYTRLFIGPKSPPAVPYASFYLSESHLLMTVETIEVRKQYLEAGMAVKELYSIPDDHIGIELEFVYYLTQKIIEYFEHGKREEASRLFEIRSNFLSEHMASWLPLFGDRIIEFTSEDFYKGAAYILKGIIEDLK